MTANEQIDFEKCDRFLIANLTDAVDRLRYTYKTQEKAASRFLTYENRRKRIMITCTVLATGTFLLSLFTLLGYEFLGTLVVGLLAMLSTFASSLGDVLNYSKKQQEHHDAGTKVRSLFVQSETLLFDYLAGAITASEARKSRDKLQDDTDQLLLTLPRTTRKDYKKANKSLSGDERTSAAQEDAMRALQSKNPDEPTPEEVQ